MEVVHYFIVAILISFSGDVISLPPQLGNLNSIPQPVDDLNSENVTCTGKHPNLNFKLTKSIDIRVESNMDKWNPTLNEMIQTQIAENIKGKPNISVHSSANPIPPEPEIPKLSDLEQVRVERMVQSDQKNILNRLDSLTNKIQSMQNILEKSSCDSNKSFSDNGGDNSELCKILVGKSKPIGCEVIENKMYNGIKRIIPKNCKEIQENGQNKSGIYEIQPKTSSKSFMVLCDMDTKGGGWTHIQRRVDGSQDFFLEWRDYKFGFGDLTGEFWIGLENIYHITGFEVNELLVEIVDRDKIKAYALYKAFGIGPEPDGYPLNVLRGFSGDAGDSLTEHLGAKFSTKDMDQDTYNANCAQLFLGGWWYKSCHVSNLNGKYMNMPLPAAYKFQGLHWKAFRGHEYCHASARMLVRPIEA